MWGADSQSEDDRARRHQRAGEVAVEANERPASEREAFVAGACGDDQALLEAVHALLHGLRISEDFLEQGPGAALRERADLTNPSLHRAAGAGWPSVIGEYQIIGRLGIGGMGAVFEAEQPSLGRRVALKIVTPGLLTPEMARRFAREAEILGGLEHPGIARVYEAGTTSDGVPYFAMELIDGTTLTEHASALGLSRASRLELLANTCDAIEHAHARGIVHRDLKPANILVDRSGQPKVLDFGVARPMDASLNLTGVRTRTGQIVGTITYMSPEQAAGGSLGPESDVYSFGLIAFEVLTGRLPYDLGDLPVDEALAFIRHGDVSIVNRLEPSVAGDLGTILEKALDKDPARRYATAGALAADLRRFLREEPIAARPPSPAYRLSKFVRRHRALVATTSLIVLSLAIGTAAALVSAVKATNARDAAEQRTYRASLAAAIAAVGIDNPQSAIEQLALAPEHLRGWEWRQAQAMADSGGVDLVLPAGASGLVLDPSGSAAFTMSGRGDQRTVYQVSLPGLAVLGRWPLAARPVSVPRDALPVAVVAGLEDLHAPGATEQAVTFEDLDGEELLVARRCVAAPYRGHRVESDVAAVSIPAGLAVVRLDSEHGRQGLCVLATGEIRFVTPGLGRQAAFDASGRRLAQADYNDLYLWNTETGELQWQHRDREMQLVSVVFSADGARLMTGSHAGDGRVRVFDVATGDVIEEREWSGGFDQSWCVAGSSPRFAWSAGDGHVHVFEGDLDRKVATVRPPRRDRLRIRLSPDGQQLIAAGPAGLQAWELEPAPAVRTFEHGSYVYGVRFSADGARIVSGGWGGDLHVRSTITGAILAEIPAPESVVHPSDLDAGRFGRITGLDVSTDGARLAFATLDGQVVIADMVSGEVLATRRVLEVFGTAVPQFHPDQSLHPLIAVTRHETRLVDARTLDEVAVLDYTRDMAAWSPDGRLIAAGGHDSHGVIVDAETLLPVARLDGPVAENLFWISWSPDGQWIATSAGDGVIRIFSAADGSEIRHLVDAGMGRAFGAIFTPDGRRILSGGDDGAVRSWDAMTGELIATIPGHSWYVYSLALTPDGSRLATGSGDGTLRLWDARPRKERIAAKRDHARLREAITPRVEGLLLELPDADAVMGHLRRDAGLQAAERDAAIQLVLERAREPLAAAGSPGHDRLQEGPEQEDGP